MTSLFKRSVNRQLTKRRRQPPEFQEASISNFSGGLNTVDNDLQIDSKYAKDLYNFYKQGDGSQKLRFGTKFLYNVSSAVSGDIIEVVDFQNHLVVFTDDGEAAKITTGGVITAIWDSTIAAALPGAPSGWSTGLTQIDFTEFKNELVVCNGTDKPILIDDSLAVTYLQDLATGSNTNTPIGKYVTTSANYTVIAGISSSPDVIYISNSGTSGTWPSDPAPNDSISLNVAAYAPQTGGTIRGLSAFKNFLFIHFATATVVFQLGTYDGSTHDPTYIETINQAGILSHRFEIVLPEASGFMTNTGFKRIKQNSFGTATVTQLMSEKIQKTIQGKTPTSSANRLKSFSFFNSADNSIWMLFYNGTTYDMFIGGTDQQIKRIAWSEGGGWAYTCATVSESKRVYLCRDSYVFQLGNELYDDEDYTADEVDFYTATWATTTAYVVGDKVIQSGTAYRCIEAHTSGTFATDLANEYWEENDGDDIDFRWELPWTDVNARMRKKHLGYMGFDTTGASTFTLQLFVDNIILDADGNYDPALTLDMVGGDSGGYGSGPQPYGGGRRTADERRWGFPLEFNKMKIRISGSDKSGLGFSTITILYKQGAFHR